MSHISQPTLHMSPLFFLLLQVSTTLLLLLVSGTFVVGLEETTHQKLRPTLLAAAPPSSGSDEPAASSVTSKKMYTWYTKWSDPAATYCERNENNNNRLSQPVNSITGALAAGVAMLVVLINSQGAPESLILSLLLLALGITTFGMHANGTNKWWVVADGINMYIILLYLMSMNFTGGQYKQSIAIAMSIIPLYILLPWLNHIAVCVALITIWLMSYFIAPGECS